MSITSPIMHRLRILFLRFYTPPDSFLSILLFRLEPIARVASRDDNHNAGACKPVYFDAERALARCKPATKERCSPYASMSAKS